VAKSQRFRVRVGTREHDVSVEANQTGGYRVEVDGEVTEVSAAPGDTTLVRDAAGRQLVVTLDQNGRPSGASVGGVAVDVQVRSAEEAVLDEVMSRGGAGGGGRVEAPMPGRVVKLLVSEGDAVERGAPILVIEAMKMENELHAPCDGRVTSIAVSTGDAVEAGQLLCDIEDQADASS
jgi:biotin carboxyl carrier protein